MPTVSSELDRLAQDVLAVLAGTKPPRNYAEAARVLYERFALRVTPDNLRAWHVRRVAVDLSDRTPADVRCDIDDYAEAIRLWREERRTWATIARLLDEGFGFKASEQTLRGWWWRRKNMKDKVTAASADVARGVAAMTGTGTTVPAPAPAAGATTPGIRPAQGASAPAPAPQAVNTVSRALPGETDVQRRIRENREREAAGSGIQDALLNRLAATTAAQGGAPE